MADDLLGSAYAEPLIYYTKVAGALAKQVYIAEKLAPPTSLQTIMGAYRTMWEKATNLSFWTHTVPAGEWKSLLVYGVEAVGFFSVGEIVRGHTRIRYTDPTDRQAPAHRLQDRHARPGCAPLSACAARSLYYSHGRNAFSCQTSSTPFCAAVRRE